MTTQWTITFRRIVSISLCCAFLCAGILPCVPAGAAERVDGTALSSQADGESGTAPDLESLRAEGSQDALFGSLLVWFLIISVVSITLLIG